MSKKILLLLAFLPTLTFGQWAFRSEGQSRSYQEAIQSYRWLEKQFDNCRLDSLGTTDSGRPLHIFFMGRDIPRNLSGGVPDDVLVILVNNGIHPGESCGIDASLDWAKDLITNEKFFDKMLIAVIPVYNIGGMLQRRPNTRANQQGPVLQGFRGNAQNLDLNRDFVKADAANTHSFYRVFSALDPDIFIDTHTSNGADYPYTMTLIATQKDKLAPSVAKLMTETFTPGLYEAMEKRSTMVPYVNVFGKTPDKGYAAFLETPRFASGYTALHHTLGYITEAHMLKSYEERVIATQAFLEELLPVANTNRSKILDARKEARGWSSSQSEFPIQWKLDSSQVEDLAFDTYGYDYVESDLGGYKRLLYNKEVKPKSIPYLGSYSVVEKTNVPKYYIIPSSWREVVLRLKDIGVNMEKLSKDTIITVESSYLTEPKFANRPYEGRFMVSDFTEVRKEQQRLFYKGDYLIPLEDNNAFLLVSLLEPRAVDSYLRWGFFHSIFQRKEYFSTYVYEDTAEELLEANSELKKEFEEWKKVHPQEVMSPYQVLDFVYKRSNYYEPEHLRYPIARLY